MRRSPCLSRAMYREPRLAYKNRKMCDATNLNCGVLCVCVCVCVCGCGCGCGCRCGCGWVWVWVGVGVCGCVWVCVGVCENNITCMNA